MCFGLDNEEALTSKRINDDLKKDAKKEEITQSLLLLGAGESGKSTILKQFKILHLNGFSGDELAAFREDLRCNVLQAIGGLARSTLSNATLAIRPDLVKSAETLAHLNEFSTPLTSALATSITALWNDPAIRETYSKRLDKQLQSNAGYLLDAVERISSPVYIPTETDVLCCRVRTTGCVDLRFQIDNVPFKYVSNPSDLPRSFKISVIDVGGQRSERKKWIHFFDVRKYGVTSARS